tara:strand:+ start:278 stop:481 length:204 start_codon:yes stop_codon:yes gene_type:complete
MQGDKVIGTVTSGEWGHRVNKNLAYVFVAPEHAAIGSAAELDLCGQRVATKVIPFSPYDPDNLRMRS